MEEPQTVGKVFDQIVESMRQNNSSMLSGAKRSTLALQTSIPKTFGPWEKYFPVPDCPRSLAEVDEPARSAIREVVDGKQPWPLVLVGQPGVGKTCAALCLFDHCCRAVYAALPHFCDMMNLAQVKGLPWFIDAQDGGSGTWYDTHVWSRVKGTELMIIDEIGCREKVSDSHYERLKGILDRRSRKPLIAISNLPLEKLADIYDSRIVSRLGEGTIVEMIGADRRLL